MLENKETPYGYCHCGCGQKTNLHKQSWAKMGFKKGEPKKYIYQHHLRGPKTMGVNNNNWRGGEYKCHSGHVMVYHPSHPYAMKNDYIKRSRDVMENELGYILPRGVIIHHKNHIRDDDRPKNLHVFKSHKEHAIFHQNEKAKKACGHSHWRLCSFCHKYDDPKNMAKREREPKSPRYYHMECQRIYGRKRYRARKREATTSL